MRCWRGYLLKRSANSLHIVQLMPLPPHHVCFSKIQNGLSFWYRPTWVVPDKGSQNGCSCCVVLSYIMWLTGDSMQQKTIYSSTYSLHAAEVHIRPVFIGAVISRLRICVVSIHIITSVSILQTVTFIHCNISLYFPYQSKKSVNACQQTSDITWHPSQSMLLQHIYPSLRKLWLGHQRSTKGKLLWFTGVGS